MNENYLNYLYSYSGSTMTYPIWDNRFTVERKDVSFVKKEVKRHDFLSTPYSISSNKLFTPEQVDGKLFLQRFYQTFLNSSYGIISNFEDPIMAFDAHNLL